MKKIEDYTLLENTSKIYYNGSQWDQKRYGKCTIVGLLEKNRNYHIFLVQFDNGALIPARHSNIKSGNVKNVYDYSSICGVACQGMYEVSDFSKILCRHWRQMINRCYNSNHISYKNYGLRGIKVCDRWLCFEYFLKDILTLENCNLLCNGHEYQLDRIDNNADYSLENCHIVSCKENARNRRSNTIVKVYFNNELIDKGHITDITKKYHIERQTIMNRVKNNIIKKGYKFEIED